MRITWLTKFERKNVNLLLAIELLLFLQKGRSGTRNGSGWPLVACVWPQTGCGGSCRRIICAISP